MEDLDESVPLFEEICCEDFLGSPRAQAIFEDAMTYPTGNGRWLVTRGTAERIRQCRKAR
jgi:hypothetical protein